MSAGSDGRGTAVRRVMKLKSQYDCKDVMETDPEPAHTLNPLAAAMTRISTMRMLAHVHGARVGRGCVQK